MSPPQTNRREHRRRLLALTATASVVFGLLAIVGGPAPVDAHGSKWGAAGKGSATRFDVAITVWDVSGDGHCAKGRLHLGGRWRVRATDCSHSPVSNGVGSSYTPASGTISASACIDRHSYNSSTCHYGSFTAPFGRVNLGNTP